MDDEIKNINIVNIPKNYEFFKNKIEDRLLEWLKEAEKNVKELIDKSNLTNKEYIQIAQVMYKDAKNPEVLFELFENKIVAYVYLLIEYEMIDKAKEIVKENDIKYFEYYLLLRENNIKVDIKEYLNATI